MFEQNVDVTARLDQIKRLTDELAILHHDSQTARLLLSAIRRELALTRDAVKTLETQSPFNNRR